MVITSDGVTAMLTAAKTAREPAPLRVLLVGNQEEDFFLIREILERSRNLLVADLDHAHSLEEAKVMVQQRRYSLVLFEHETGDVEAVHFVAEFLHAGVSIPFVLLTEDADEKTVADMMGGGTWNGVAKSQRDGCDSRTNYAEYEDGHGIQDLLAFGRGAPQSAGTRRCQNRKRSPRIGNRPAGGRRASRSASDRGIPGPARL